MKNETVAQLAQLRGEPSVSILCSLDALRPGNQKDPLVLASLRERAEEQVRANRSGRAVSEMMSRIDDALAEIDLDHPTAGVAVFVSPDVSRVIALDSSVDPEVVVGDRFAIHGVLRAQQRRPRVRVMVLSQAKIRCVDLTGPNASERLDFGFPLELQPPVEADTPHGDFPRDEHEHAEAAKFVLRAADRALDSLQQRDERPLVLLGVERDLAYYDEITKHGANVIGRLHGDYERHTADSVAALVQPVLDADRLVQQQQACAALREAIGTRAVAGIAATWTAARAGRGHQLLVEDEFRYPARVADDVLEPTHADDSDTFDAVEVIVEEVVRHGGEVLAVDRDSLADVGRIALVTRY